MKIKRICMLFCLFCAFQVLIAQNMNAEQAEPIFTQRLSWKKANNVFEYKVVIERIDSDFVQIFTTKDTFVEFSLSAGNYRYKIITLDFLGRESKSTEYKNFSIIKAQRPKVTLPEEQVPFGYTESNELYITMPFEHVSEASSVQVINEDTDQIYEGFIEFESNNFTCAIYMPEIPVGKYYFVIKNPSGLTGKSDIFEVSRKSGNYFLNKYREVTEAEQDQTVVTELVQENDEELDFSQNENVKSSKTRKIALSGGIIDFVFAETDFKKMYKMQNIPLLFSASYSVLSGKKEISKIGFEVNGFYGFNDVSESTFNINWKYFGAKVYFVARLNTTNDILGFNVKAGPGFMALGYGINFSEPTQSQFNADFDFYKFATIGGEVSFDFTLFKKLTTELGASVDYVFIPNSKTLSINPFVKFGIKF